MPRSIPPGRFDRIVRKATEEFITRGYRRTQMSDIADAVGVSKATLYLYVESKDALFALCALNADARDEIELPASLPVPTPPDLAARIAKRTEAAAALPHLREALTRPRADDIASELREVLEEHFDVLEQNCRAIKLMDRSWDHPQLGSIWQSAAREQPRNQLVDYVASRMSAGQICARDEPRIVARIALELIATWAVHIKWDRAPEAYEAASTRREVVEFIMRGLEVS